jgi:ketosteroid isomerase-like protein
VPGGESTETANERPARLFAEAITAADLDASLAVCHPEIEFFSMLGLTGRAYLGHDGIRQYFDDVASAWDEWRVEVHRVVEGTDGRVAIIMTMHARGKGSGTPLSERTGHVWTVRDGLLLRNEPYREPDLALVAVGLSPQRRTPGSGST